MHTWQPQQPPQQSHVALGALIALAVVGAAIALLTALDRRETRDQPGLAAAISELHDARVEMQASANELRSAAATLEAASRNFERRATTVNILDVMAPPPTPPAMPMPPALMSSDPIVFEGVHCSEPGRCTISRATVEGLLADPVALSRQARVIPSVKDGVARGLKFYGIRPGSLPKALGLKNGDLLVGVNERPLTDMESSMQLYSGLRRADELRLAIERKGEPLTLTLKID